MSTITVVKKNGFAAIAADTLTMYGSSKESAKYIINHSKIVHCSESYIALCGPTSSKVVLNHYFSHLEKLPSLNNVDEIFAAWMDIHEALKETYFVRPEEDSNDSYESSRMDVLIANPHGIFGVEARRSIQEFAKFSAYGSGDEYALGAMYGIYNDPEKSAEDIARFGIEAAAEFDSSTGLPIISYSVKLNAEN